MDQSSKSATRFVEKSELQGVINHHGAQVAQRDMTIESQSRNTREVEATLAEVESKYQALQGSYKRLSRHEFESLKTTIKNKEEKIKTLEARCKRLVQQNNTLAAAYQNHKAESLLFQAQHERAAITYANVWIPESKGPLVDLGEADYTPTKIELTDCCRKCGKPR